MTLGVSPNPHRPQTLSVPHLSLAPSFSGLQLLVLMSVLTPQLSLDPSQGFREAHEPHDQHWKVSVCSASEVNIYSFFPAIGLSCYLAILPMLFFSPCPVGSPFLCVSDLSV